MEEKKIYLPRIIEHTITTSMLTNGCVVIEGPKWCGKSTTAERFAKSVVKLQKPATFRQYKLLADIGIVIYYLVKNLYYLMSGKKFQNFGITLEMKSMKWVEKEFFC